MAVQQVIIPYAPRPQFIPYHERKERFAKIVAHRRFGKTVGCINDKIKQAITNERQFPPPRYSYIAPTFTQAKDVAWGYVKHYCSAIPGIKTSESELFVEFPHNGARFKLYGADNYDRMRGTYNDDVTIDEPAQHGRDVALRIGLCPDLLDADVVHVEYLVAPEHVAQGVDAPHLVTERAAAAEAFYHVQVGGHAGTEAQDDDVFRCCLHGLFSAHSHNRFPGARGWGPGTKTNPKPQPLQLSYGLLVGATAGLNSSAVALTMAAAVAVGTSLTVT